MRTDKDPEKMSLDEAQRLLDELEPRLSALVERVARLCLAADNLRATIAQLRLDSFDATHDAQVQP